MYKTFYLFSIILATTFSYSQFKSDFMISDSGTNPIFKFDENGKIHMVWGNTQKRDRSAQYSAFDSLGNVVYQSRKISSVINVGNPSLSINKDLVACVWEDRVSLDLTIFSTYMKGKILKNGIDFSSEVEFDDNNIVVTDAYRRGAEIVWLNDSLLFAVWFGDGTRSFSVGYSDIYFHKLKFPPLQTTHPLDTIFNDSKIKISETKQSLIKHSSGSGYLVIWVEKDSVGKWKIGGNNYDDSLKAISNKMVFVAFDTLEYNSISKPSVMHKKNGNIIIVWEKDTTNYKSNIYFQEFSEQGTPVGVIQKANELLATGGSEVSSDIDSEGNSIIVWENEADLIAQRYSSNMVKIGSNFRINKIQTGENIYSCVKLRNRKIYSVWTKFVDISPNIWMNILDFDNPTSVINETINGPQSFSLSQNYPNPFNPSTIIAFSIPQSGNVTLNVFDVLGREVALLVNEVQSAGKYTVQFNGSSLSSGIYFYRLQSGNYVETKKLLLMK